jgi:hypothetical protein
LNREDHEDRKGFVFLRALCDSLFKPAEFLNRLGIARLWSRVMPPHSKSEKPAHAAA